MQLEDGRSSHMRIPMANLLMASLVCLLLPAAALGQTRSFMVQLGSDPAAAPTSGATSLQAAAGSTVSIAVYLEEKAVGGVCPGGAGSLCLNGIQVVVPWFATPLDGATGTVQYKDLAAFPPPDPGGNSILIDKANPDWIFANLAPAQFLPISYNETNGDVFGA